MSILPCPCDLGRPNAECCSRYRDASSPLHLLAPDAAALMRSRYSAFAADDRAYLLATWHPSTRPALLEDPPPGLRWLGLELRRHQADGDRATVEFVARSKLAGRAMRLHELSRFVREGGRWYYVDGELK